MKGLVKSLRYCGLSQIECHTRNLAQIALFQVLTTPLRTPSAMMENERKRNRTQEPNFRIMANWHNVLMKILTIIKDISILAFRLLRPL